MPNTTVPSPLVSRSSAAGPSVDGAPGRGASVAGASVEGASVDGGSVDTDSALVSPAAGASVDMESSSSSPQAALTRPRAATAAMNFFDVLMMLPRKTGVLS